MRAAVALLASRVRSGQADLYGNYDQVNADKRLLLQRTIHTLAALDSDSHSDSHSRSTSDNTHNRRTAADGSTRRQQWQWRGSRDNVLPLLTLLPLADTSPPQKDGAEAWVNETSEDGTEEAEVAAVEVLAVDAVYESGLADNSCCDGRWLIRAVVRSRSPHTLHSLTLHATTADQRAEVVCHSSAVSLSPSSAVCLLCSVDVLSITSAELINIRALLIVSHTDQTAATSWSERVQLPRFSHPNQHLSLLPPSEQSVDVPIALSLSSLSSALHPISLRLDASPPLTALSSLIQQHLHLRPVDHTCHHTWVCGAAAAHLAASDELLVASSASSLSDCPFPGVCCVLSTQPSTGSSYCCSLRLYTLTESAALSFLFCLRSALPSSCAMNVDVANQLSLTSIQYAVAALVAETEEALSSSSEMERLWREMELPAIVGSSSAVRANQLSTAAAGGHEAQTTQAMISRYYEHVDSRVRLQRSTDERLTAVHSLADGADSVQPAVR